MSSRYYRSISLVLLLIFISVIGFLVVYHKTWPLKAREVGLNTVTEYLLTPFGYPHPYKLQFVAQYRFVHQVGEFLVRRDNHQQFIGGLAQGWTISPDRRTIRFHLRSGLYTATETAQSLKRLLRAGQTSHSNLGAQTDEESIKVIDESNLEIHTFGDAGAILAPLVMADAVILPDDHWITVPGFSEPQVDWKKIKGPYIYKAGEFPLKEGKSLLFVPNPSHYFYDRDQVDWKLEYEPFEKISELAQLKALIEREPSFTTVRYWDFLKLFSTKDPGLFFYETRPNGVAFVLPNLQSDVLKEKRARLTLLKRVLRKKPELIQEKMRANQIAQPGLSGRLMDEDLKPVLESIESEPDFDFRRTLVWAAPQDAEFNKAWIEKIATAMGVPYEVRTGPTYPTDPQWTTSSFDLIIGSIGMSDTDPISGATFLFSPSGIHADLPDGVILKRLNSGKESSDRSVIVKSVRDAFRMALENGVIIPLSYVANRHYYSDGVQLNIQDPFAESVRIWEVRLKR